MTLTFIQDHMDVWRKNCTPIFSQRKKGIWLLFRLVGLMNHILILSDLMWIQGREPCLCDLVLKKAVALARIQTFFSEIWYGDRDLGTLHFDTSLDYLDLHSRSQLYEIPKTSVLISSQSSLLIWMKCRMLPQPVGLLKFIITLLHLFKILGRELS